MSYYFAKTLPISFDEAISRATAALQAEGFGVLTDVDVEDKVGTMLPCNVIVQEATDGRTEVAAIDPVASMQAIQNPDLAERASLVRDKLQRAIESL